MCSAHKPLHLHPATVLWRMGTWRGSQTRLPFACTVQVAATCEKRSKRDCSCGSEERCKRNCSWMVRNNANETVFAAHRIYTRPFTSPTHTCQLSWACTLSTVLRTCWKSGTDLWGPTWLTPFNMNWLWLNIQVRWWLLGYGSAA